MWATYFVLCAFAGAFRPVPIDASVYALVDRIQLESEKVLVAKGYNGIMTHSRWIPKDAATQIVAGKNVAIRVIDEYNSESICIELFDHFGAVSVTDVYLCSALWKPSVR